VPFGAVEGVGQVGAVLVLLLGSPGGRAGFRLAEGGGQVRAAPGLLLGR
jgi:hypothetical protein